MTEKNSIYIVFLLACILISGTFQSMAIVEKLDKIEKNQHQTMVVPTTMTAIVPVESEHIKWY